MSRAGDGVNMDQDKRTEKIHDLDMEYQGTRHQSELVVKDEEARRLKLRTVLLRDENANLKDQLRQKDVIINQLSAQCDDIRIQLDSMSEKSLEQEKQMRIQAREQSNMKTELLSLSGVTQDSAKLLSEKLALSRELALLKPEVEHLRSQLTQQKDVLAEKLDLERQLNALEVELVNEKRAVQRAVQRQESQDNAAEEELRQQVQDLENKLAGEKRAAKRAKKSQENNSEVEEELRLRVEELEKQLASEQRSAQRAKRDQSSKETAVEEQLRQKLQNMEKELAKERRERQQSQKDNERRLTEAREQTELVEQRLADMKLKLREAREETKSARAELMAARQGPVLEKVPAKLTLKPQARRKRRANEISEDEMVIHTPKNIDARPKRPLKKRGLDQTLVGEKSNFSITPFLNKTINFADHSMDFTAGGRKMTTDQDKTTSASEIESSGDSIVVEPLASSAANEPTVEVRPARKAKPAAKEPKTRGRPAKAKALGEAAPSKRNLKAPSTRKMARSEPTLEKVMEEADEPSTEQENRSADSTTSLKQDVTLPVKTTTARSSGASAASLETEPKKKKRKLLGGATKTIFDDDDGEPALVPATKRSVKALGPARGLGKSGLGLKRNAFAASSFSPLKRERRGVNASFLA